jgi:hypothetical protein
MLSNKDFSKLLSEPKGGQDKVKFDLNQIKQWDNQIHAKLKAKSNVSKHESTVEEGKDNKNDKSGEATYRDRALERRLNANPDYDPAMENMTSLDIEQTKYLGGDEEHTHLVKGLDYSLLQKVKMTTQKTSASEKDDLANHSQADIVTCTPLGERLKQILFKKDSVPGKDIAPSQRFLSMSYEYSMDTLAENIDRLPTIVMASRQVSATHNYILNYHI